jgi:hypothetical protein
MKIDMNNLKTMIFSAKPSDRLLLIVSSLEQNSLQMCQKEIEKFIKKEEDYVIIVIRK